MKLRCEMVFCYKWPDDHEIRTTKPVLRFVKGRREASVFAHTASAAYVEYVLREAGIDATSAEIEDAIREPLEQCRLYKLLSRL